MLKQLKNNMELEGGEQKWLKDYYLYPNPEAAEAAEPVYQPETFLVFNNNFTEFNDVKLFSKLVLKSVDIEVLKKSENKENSDGENDEQQNFPEDPDDKKKLMTQDEFFKKFIYGYIVTKTGPEYTYRLFDVNVDKTFYKYEEINDYLTKLKKSCNYITYGDEPEERMTIDKQIYDLITDQIAIFNTENIKFFESTLKPKIDEIKDSVPMKTLLEYNDQKMDNFADMSFDDTNNTTFLLRLTEKIKKKDAEKPLNMIIKIDENKLRSKEIHFIESTAGITNSYNAIQKIIQDDKAAKKTEADNAKNKANQ
jgi:hypothetical protein